MQRSVRATSITYGGAFGDSGTGMPVLLALERQ